VSRSWYARSVLAVRDAPQSLQFYASKLGFKEDWRYEEDARLRIVQVSRQGCELILSDQWPEDAGLGRIFISLDPAEFTSAKEDLADRGVELKSGEWGYELLVVEDPDGNRLWFPHPQEQSAAG
jgi:catechol 2,3-dioxygenase-like lactoylglutathione lyase family enzyme